jgi:hypothetical protein
MAAKPLRYIKVKKHIILYIKLIPKKLDIKPLQWKHICFIRKQISAAEKRQTASLTEF